MLVSVQVHLRKFEYDEKIQYKTLLGLCPPCYVGIFPSQFIEITKY